MRWETITGNESIVARIMNVKQLEIQLSCGVIGNTSDFGSEELGFEPLRDNKT